MWGETIRYAEVTSTNDLARDHARRGATEGTAVLANYQSAGRGRRGRGWDSPAGRSLLVSYILTPSPIWARSAWVTLGAGIAVAQAIKQRSDLPVRLKWPNDVRVEGCKLAGILAETCRHQEQTICILGIGINLSQDKDDFPEDLRECATSLALAGARDIRAEALLESVTVQLQGISAILNRGDIGALRSRWQELDETIGHDVVVESPEGEWTGKATGIDEQGALWVDDEAGESRRVTVGDVTLRFTA